MQPRSSALYTMDLTDRRVFLRADLNVPLKNNEIASDFRLKALLPTLELLIEKKSRIILATHIGRPQKPGKQRISTKLLAPWLEKHGFTIHSVGDLEAAYEKSLTLTPGEILLLENLRFWPEEQAGSLAFAQQLARLADYYVDDAFAALHRNDTSITLLPQLFAPDKRTIGLLVEKELATLLPAFNNPKHPFLVVLGGGKVASKLPLIDGMLDRVDRLALCPALAFTFLQAEGIATGNSLVEPTLVDEARTLLHKAKQKNVSLVLPEDFQLSHDSEKPAKGPFSVSTDTTIPAETVGVSIGPKTTNRYKELIQNAGTIFYNAAMGFSSAPATQEATYALLNTLATAPGTTIIGGGSSVEALYAIGKENAIDIVSTGGGATLTLLSGGTLPGLEALD